MKAKLYIVTYKNVEKITNNVNSVKRSSFLDNQFNEINIINNSPSVNINFLNKGRIRVIPNTLRSESSFGHLSRSWNQCLINGFISLSAPDCDLLITSQDDVIFDHDWYQVVLDNCHRYDFMAFGMGDMICSYTVDAVKKAGIWDENFPGLVVKESDYFIRSVMWNKQRTSLNDVPGHINAIWNPIRQIGQRSQVGHEAERTRSDWVAYNNLHYFYTKWPGIRNDKYDINYLTSLAPTKPAFPVFSLYPHFEKDIDDLLKKGYFYDLKTLRNP